MENEMCRCPKCPYEFEWKFQVDHHVQREHTNVHAATLFHAIVEPEQFSCTCGGFRAYYNWDLYEHWKRQHHGRIDEINIEQSLLCNVEVDNKYPCTLCKFKSDSSLSLVKHTGSCEMMTGPPTVHNDDDRSSHSGAVVKKRKDVHCTECSYKTKRKDRLRKHMLRRHAPGGINIDWFQCAKCSYRTNKKSRVKEHMRIHAASEDIDWFQCAKCPYKTKWKSNVKQHMLTHACSEANAGRYQCAKCSYKAKWKSHLEQHMVTHASSEDILWFKCAKCSYKAKRKTHLKEHMLTHAASEDIHWFQCAKCSYKAKRKSHWSRHMVKLHARM